MFAKLKESAKSAASEGYAAASSAATAAKARVDVGLSAKKLLDEGGETVAAMLLAKQATQESENMDKMLANNVEDVVAAYDAASLQMTEASKLVESNAPNEFQQLAGDYHARAALLRDLLPRLKQSPAPAATMSPVEADAVVMLRAKLKASGLRQSVSSIAETSSEAGTGSAWLSKARGSLDATKEVAGDRLVRIGERVEAAMPGKKMVDEGGDEVKVKLLAKKASQDAVALDVRINGFLKAAVEAYDLSLQKIKESVELSPQESSTFESIRPAAEGRSQTLKEMMSCLPPMPQAATVSAEEKNGILYLLANMTFDSAKSSASSTKQALSSSLQEAQGKVAEAAMGQALSKATGGAVSKAPEGSGAAAVQFAKENPEQAKAAMQFAAKHA
eukprot:TRINITY_DN2815_c0_g1_i1.p1 TRINITY_DN2815_c0_g1~~TRINITY_DN2815_c0_g1_i1.p1  ORF type:complete len:390 (+),score=125.02 TRINITY_DN2815_c0_g1_i1:99-1268(+)